MKLFRCAFYVKISIMLASFAFCGGVLCADNEKLSDYSRKLNVYCDALNDEINFLVKYPQEKESGEIQKLLYDVYVVEIQRIFEEYRKEYDRFAQVLNTGNLKRPAPGFEILEEYETVCKRVEMTLRRFQALEKGNTYGIVKDFRETGIENRGVEEEKIRDKGVVNIGDRAVPLLKSDLNEEKEVEKELKHTIKGMANDYSENLQHGSTIKKINTDLDEFSFPEKYVDQRYEGKIQRLREQNNIQKKVDEIKTQIKKLNQNPSIENDFELLEEIEKNESGRIKKIQDLKSDAEFPVNLEVVEKTEDFTLKTSDDDDFIYRFHSNSEPETKEKLTNLEKKTDSSEIPLDFGWKAFDSGNKKNLKTEIEIDSNIFSSEKKGAKAKVEEMVVKANETKKEKVLTEVIADSSKKIDDPGTEPEKKLVKQFTISSTPSSQKKKEYDRMISVMVENHRASRPHTGLDKAEVIYEILAEGGITRFMAFYDPDTNVKVGPVRSSRDYFLTRNAEFDAVYVHCGASPKAFSIIDEKKIDSINEIKRPKGFYRDSERNAPHNLYADLSIISQLFDNYGFSNKTSIDPLNENFPRLLKEKRTANPQNKGIDIRYHKRYQVGFTYDVASNSYLRTINKEPHTDRVTGKQLSFKNVVIERVEVNFIKNDDKGRIDMEFKEGEGFLLRGGEKIDITYKKSDYDSPMKYTDKKGNPVFFNPGTVMVVVINKSAQVKF